MRALALVVWFSSLVCAQVAAQPLQAKHAQVELLSLQADAVPGTDLLVGVHFVLEKGWHIYWVNPGDSGQPPTFQWQLPAGFTAGSIEWPRPERMQSSSQLADYGYHDDVLLMVPVKAAQFINIDGRPVLEFSVDAKWLICREVCLPDHARLRGEWGVGTGRKPSPQTAALFAKTQQLLPKPLPVSRMADVFSHPDSFVISLETHPLTGPPQFFPLERGQVDNAAPQRVEPRPPQFRVLTLTLKKSELLLKPIKVLRGVLVLPGDGIYQVEIPVEEGKGIK